MSQQSVRQWSAEQVRSDNLPKKDLINILQDNAAYSFLKDHRLLGNIENVAKTAIKEQIVDAITSCLSAKATEMVEKMTKQVKAVKAEVGPKCFRIHPS
ncbi:peptidyl-prolyl cis-trans isomerase FKBP3-like [Stigmatopora argus]